MRRAKKVAGGVLLTAVAFSAPPALGASVSFDSPSDLDGFTQRRLAAGTTIPATTTSGFQYSAAAGRSGSGGVTPIAGGDTQITATYAPETFDPSANQPITLGAFFQVSAANPSDRTGNLFQLGLDTKSNSVLADTTSGGFVSIFVKDASTSDSSFELRYASKSISNPGYLSTTMGSPFTLTGGDWYRLTATFTRTGTASQMTFAGTLEDWGAGGDAFVSTVSAPSPVTDFGGSVYDSTAVYGAFESQEQTGFAAMDSFTATITPEPCSLGFVAVAALLVRRGRR